MKQFILCYFIIGIASAQTVKNDTISQNLDEIIIVNTAKTFSNKNGDIKIDVANSIYKSVPDVLDLLSKLPKIIISADRENLSIIGKGNPMIYIDNMKVEMTDLLSLSVDDIKSIEIINNPSGKYEADGKAVILITRKKNSKEGFQTNVSEVASFKKHFNLYNGFHSTIKNEKIEISVNFNYNRLNPWESNGNEYEIPSRNIKSDYLVAGFTKRHQFIFGTRIYRQLNSGDYISFSVNGKSQKDDFGFTTLTNNSENGIENDIATNGNNDSEKNFVNASFNYNHKIKDLNAEIFTGIRYSELGQQLDIVSFNNYNDTQFRPFNNSKQAFDIDSFSSRIDFIKKYINEMKLETGISYSKTVANTLLEIADFEKQTVSDSKYRLNEALASAYVQTSGNINKILWSNGIRIENTAIIGQNDGENKPLIDKKYVNIFPEIQFGLPLDSTKTITVNYAKSISRPDFSAASQGMTYINPYFLFAGNINLNPAISDEFSVSLQYLDKSLKVMYYKNKDVVNYSFLYDDVQNLLTYRPENFEKESGYSLELTLPFSNKAWSSMNSFSFIINKIEDAGALSADVKPYLYYYTNQTLKLKNDFILSATAWGLTKRSQGILENSAFFILDLAAAKPIFKNLICTISASDVFNNMNFKEKFNMQGVRTTGNYFTDTREFSISLKYTFGKVNESPFEQKAIDDNLNRMK